MTVGSYKPRNINLSTPTEQGIGMGFSSKYRPNVALLRDYTLQYWPPSKDFYPVGGTALGDTLVLNFNLGFVSEESQEDCYKFNKLTFVVDPKDWKTLFQPSISSFSRNEEGYFSYSVNWVLKRISDAALDRLPVFKFEFTIQNIRATDYEFWVFATLHIARYSLSAVDLPYAEQGEAGDWSIVPYPLADSESEV